MGKDQPMVSIGLFHLFDSNEMAEKQLDTKQHQKKEKK